MLSKCANPACDTSFHYLHDGRLFQMETGGASAEALQLKKTPRKVEYFWLCNRCAAEMTLKYEQGTGVVAVPYAQVQRAAAS